MPPLPGWRFLGDEEGDEGSAVEVEGEQSVKEITSVDSLIMTLATVFVLRNN